MTSSPSANELGETVTLPRKNRIQMNSLLQTLRRYSGALFLGAALTVASPALALDDAEKEEMGAFIREYLIANPEIMIEVQQALETRQQASLQERAGAAIAASASALFEAPGDVALGNPDGDVTIVEFFDYNCGYCKRAHADMKAIIASDDNVRVILKEFPILGPDSIGAHRISMAFRAVSPEQYGAFQDALMTGERADEASAIAVAAELGVEEAALREKLADPQIDAQIRQSYQLADALGISGTPSYVIGDEAVYGAMGAEFLIQKIENVRSCDSATC
jgi:protein-disulfide isomerase